jgi:molybdenum cofactor cytidylyltransferase
VPPNKDIGMESKQDLRVGAVILAAGQSSRMGEPKQLLSLGGKTLLARTLENVRAARVTDIVLVLGFAAEIIAEQVADERVKVVVNEDYQQGMGVSLRTGLSALAPVTDAALIVLADQPFVRPQTLDEIIDRYQHSSAQIVVPIYQGFRGNPVLLDRSVFHEVMALGGDIGCRAIFGNHVEGILKFDVDDIGILLDIDSKEDFAKFQRFDQNSGDQAALIEAANLHGRDLPEAEEPACDNDELVIVGAGPVAVALTKLGKLLHFTVTIVDPLLQPSDVPNADGVLNTLEFSRPQPSSRRYVIVASRGRFDEEMIEHALRTKIDYVALLANRERAGDIRHGLELKGLTSSELAKFHAPAGLAIGAKTPAEIALSIMAEIVSIKRKPSANE